MIRGAKIIMCYATFAFAFFAASISEGQAVTGADVSKLLNSVATMGSKACDKGSIFSTKVTFRSFGGLLCSIKPIGAIATLACENKEDFADSGCGKRAEKAMGDQTPIEVLAHTIHSGGSKTKGMICKLQGKIKPLQKVCGSHHAAIEAGDMDEEDQGEGEDE